MISKEPPAVPDLTNVDDEDDSVDHPASSIQNISGTSTTEYLLTNEQTSNIPEASPQMVTGFPNSSSVGGVEQSHHRASQDYAVGSLGLYMAIGPMKYKRSSPRFMIRLI